MKRITKILSLILVITLMIALVPVNVDAASKTKINKKSTTIYVGNTTNLKVSGTSKKIKWSTSNKKVATVNSKGKVTAKKKGTATITAKISNKKYKCKVTVKNPYLNSTKKTLNIGKTYTLKLTGTKIKASSSSNKKVATVNSKGKITAKKAGKATISIKGQDNKTYKCSVTVNETKHTHTWDDGKVTTSTTIYVGNTTNLKISGTSKTVKWSTSNKEIATVNSKGKITAKKQGTVTITAKVSNKKYKCKVTVKNPYLNSTKETLNIGKTYTLELTGTKAKAYSSSNKKIATVNSKGKVTAKKSGKTTISIKGQDNKTYKCSVTVNETKHTHTWDDGKVTKEATCSTDGVKTYTCTVCGETRTEAIPATGKHTWDAGEVTTPVTCTEDGVKTYTCSVCGQKKTEPIKATGHAWNNGKITKEATCFTNVIKTYTCTVCGETRTEAIPATGEHTWDAGEVTTPATCTEDGVRTYTCSVCGHKKTEQIKATGHTISDWIIDAEATCEANGSKHKECTVCHQIPETQSIEKTGHHFTWTMVKEPSSTAAVSENDFGIRTGVCSCGDTITENIVRIDIGNGETTLMYGYYDDAMADECLSLINECRSTVTSEIWDDATQSWIPDENGCPALQKADKEMIGAKIRAAEIAYLYSHTRPNKDRLLREYFENAENITGMSYNAKQAYDAWMTSRGHAENIIDGQFEYTGIAVFWKDSDGNGKEFHPNWVNGFSMNYGDFDFVK